MSEKVGRVVGYVVIAIALIVVGAVGVRYPVVEVDPEIGARAGRVVDFIIPTTNPTATPGVVIDNQSGGSVSLQVRSAATPVVDIRKNGQAVFANGVILTAGGQTITAGGQTISAGAVDIDGTTFALDTTSGISLDADAASNFNTAGAGIDLTFESEAGRVIIKGDEAAANGVTIDANDAVTTGLDIDVGSVSGVAIDGGPTNIGGGTPTTAAGDNDLYVTADLEFDGLLVPSFANETITAGEFLTPTVMVYALDSAAAVTFTLGTGPAEGTLLVLIGDDANTITIADTNIRSSDGGVITIGQYDVVMMVMQDSEWLHISKSANS